MDNQEKKEKRPAMAEMQATLDELLAKELETRSDWLRAELEEIGWDEKRVDYALNDPDPHKALDEIELLLSDEKDYNLTGTEMEIFISWGAYQNTRGHVKGFLEAITLVKKYLEENQV
jgi:hypothetical protein